MKAGIILTLITNIFVLQLLAQRECRSHTYRQEQEIRQPALAERVRGIEQFTRAYIDALSTGRLEGQVIRIPVIVHILYHFPGEKISDAAVMEQLAILNTSFRKQNPDTASIPAVFKPLAADTEISFELATSDPHRKYTSGIIRKYTPVTKWTMDDKMKFSSEMGDDAWDPSQYLNIWVCNLDRFAGYASVVGGPEELDGIVIGTSAFTGNNKTIVHEAGHWLNLKHIWGDEYCGDDGVGDTPKQASYTPGCPSGSRVTCGNGPQGDMYMNYMDFTNDDCIHMFTTGQKNRMRALFAPYGPRNALLSSKGLLPPLIFESPIPEEDPKWLEPKLYPNPASQEVYIDLRYDMRWMGKLLTVTNLQGVVLLQVTITSGVQRVDISRLAPGMYFLAAKREDGLSLLKKFVRQ